MWLFFPVLETTLNESYPRQWQGQSWIWRKSISIITEQMFSVYLHSVTYDESCLQCVRYEKMSFWWVVKLWSYHQDLVMILSVWWGRDSLALRTTANIVLRGLFCLGLSLIIVKYQQRENSALYFVTKWWAAERWQVQQDWRRNWHLTFLWRHAQLDCKPTNPSETVLALSTIV